MQYIPRMNLNPTYTELFASKPVIRFSILGCCHTEPLLVPGGRVFVWPGIQKIQRLSLNTVTLAIDTPHVYTKLGVSISVTGIAQVSHCSPWRPIAQVKICTLCLTEDYPLVTSHEQGLQRILHIFFSQNPLVCCVKSKTFSLYPYNLQQCFIYLCAD